LIRITRRPPKPLSPAQQARRLTVGTLAALVGLFVMLPSDLGLDSRAGAQANAHGDRDGTVSAEAKIVELYDTGNRFNDTPQIRFFLEVRPKHGSPFHAAATEVLPPRDLAQMGVGSTVRALYDPRDRTHVSAIPLETGPYAESH
jgi:hypothetical protein